jgi:Zn/Cd-binding protein ZinT
MEYPSINPLIHRSTWRGCFDAWCSGFRALAIRDLECVFYLRGEPQSKVEPSEVKHLQIALYDKSITSLKIGKNTYTFHKPVPKPEFKPLQIHVGFFGRD